MARQPQGKKWWSSPEEEKLALDELQIALDKHENSKDYDKKLNATVKSYTLSGFFNQDFYLLFAQKIQAFTWRKCQKSGYSWRK